MVSKKIDEIINYCEKQITENLYYGVSLAIYDKGEWSEVYFGTQDGLRPVREDLVYDLASVSKVVGVATVVIQLINKNILDLDEKLRTYYPVFHDDSLTLRQLLTHTSGIDPFIINRDNLTAIELKDAINHIRVTDDKQFFYTDINFLLLGFMLEEVTKQSLPDLFAQYVYKPMGMSETSFGPVALAVPTSKNSHSGRVHDPKARVLGEHAGSAGLFSTVKDLEKFLESYLTEEFSNNLWQNYGSKEKPRSIGWNLDGDWIDHTGYTGPFIMANRKTQQAVIFLTNRTYAYDDRPLWIENRRLLRNVIKQSLKVEN